MSRPTFRLALLGLLLTFAACTPPRADLAEGDAPQEHRVAERTPQEVRLEASVTGPRSVALSWAAPVGEDLVLLRSTSRIGSGPVDAIRDPITSRPLPDGSEYRDQTVADGTTYHYVLRAGEHLSPAVKVDVPPLELPEALTTPSFAIDKENYTLELRDRGTPVKRYPVALGRSPTNRKLCQDNASTPEGFYTICNLQPEATYFKAYDLDYPTAVDRVRYRLAADRGLLRTPTPDIGGEIQIHGQGIQSNWTFGCIAMRNPDITELFDRPEIVAGLEVAITGSSLRAEDLESIRRPRSPAEVRSLQARLKELGYDPGTVDGQMGEATMEAVGEFQLDQELPLTCQLDARTLARLTDDNSSRR